MKKMLKTRKMLSEFLKRDKILDIGPPITDTDIKNVHKELKKFEKTVHILKICVIVLVSLLVVCMF